MAGKCLRIEAISYKHYLYLWNDADIRPKIAGTVENMEQYDTIMELVESLGL